MEKGEFKLVMSRSVDQTIKPFVKDSLYAKGNMENISKTILIKISKNPDVVENIFIGVECSQDDICQYMIIFKYFCDVFAWS
jgi:hypothetical protein